MEDEKRNCKCLVLVRRWAGHGETISWKVEASGHFYILVILDNTTCTERKLMGRDPTIAMPWTWRITTSDSSNRAHRIHQQGQAAGCKSVPGGRPVSSLLFSLLGTWSSGTTTSRKVVNHPITSLSGNIDRNCQHLGSTTRSGRREPWLRTCATLS